MCWSLFRAGNIGCERLVKDSNFHGIGGALDQDLSTWIRDVGVVVGVYVTCCDLLDG